MSTCRSKLLLALTILLPTLADAQLKNTLGFSARIADGGTPVTGSHDFVFTLFDADTAGAATWTETQTLTVSDGVVTAALGEITSLATILDGSNRWLEVSMDGTVFGPRMAVRAVPYAMKAASMNAPVECINQTTRFTLAAGADCGTGAPLCLCLVDNVYCGCWTCTSPACPAGYTLTGGGFSAWPKTTIQRSMQGTDNRWWVRATNTDTVSANLDVYARCCKVP